MTQWSLSKLFSNLHHEIEANLQSARGLGHPVAKGDSSENVWLDLLKQYLPERYRAESAFVVDSTGSFSDQVDVLIFDRQYSPFIFKFKGQMIVPAESVYAVLEAKQSISRSNVWYARNKVASVRRLYRSSAPIPYASGTYPAKPLTHIYGGLLTLDSEWCSPPLGESLESALFDESGTDDRLDIGCVAQHGYFLWDRKRGNFNVEYGGKPATEFLLKLISLLQAVGTVPMIDIDAYMRWLREEG